MITILAVAICVAQGCRVVELELPPGTTLEQCNTAGMQYLPQAPLPEGARIMSWACVKGTEA